MAQVQGDVRSAERLPADTFNVVTAEHVWNAVEKLRQPDFRHAYGPSTDFDLVTDADERFPPKAVFGVAATEALGCEILPKHFSGGRGTPCFRILENAGFAIVEKERKDFRQMFQSLRTIGRGPREGLALLRICAESARRGSLRPRKTGSYARTASYSVNAAAWIRLWSMTACMALPVLRFITIRCRWRKWQTATGPGSRTCNVFARTVIVSSTVC